MLGVSGYTEDGVMHDDGSPDHATGVWSYDEFWDNADRYTYYWEEYNGRWWRTDGDQW